MPIATPEGPRGKTSGRHLAWRGRLIMQGSIADLDFDCKTTGRRESGHCCHGSETHLGVQQRMRRRRGATSFAVVGADSRPLRKIRGRALAGDARS